MRLLTILAASLVGTSLFAQDAPAPPKDKTAEAAAKKGRINVLGKSRVPFEKIPVKITNWSDANKGPAS